MPEPGLGLIAGRGTLEYHPSRRRCFANRSTQTVQTAALDKQPNSCWLRVAKFKPLKPNSCFKLLAARCRAAATPLGGPGPVGCPRRRRRRPGRGGAMAVSASAGPAFVSLVQRLPSRAAGFVVSCIGLLGVLLASPNITDMRIK
jgi:hypothetical protein